MIYLVQKNDEGNFVSERNWRFIREQFGSDVHLITAEGVNDPKLDVITENDIVIMETRDIEIGNRILNLCRNTCESYYTIQQTLDKELVKHTFATIPYEVLTPRSYTIDSLPNSPVFIKPMFGADSTGVDKDSICRRKRCALTKYNMLKNSTGVAPMIEDYIEGRECTVAIFRIGGVYEVYPIYVNICNDTGVMTHSDKFKENEWCESVPDGIVRDAIIESAIHVFEAVDCQHYMRIDYRVSTDGKPYVIDLNLFPGLGPIDHLGKCLSICEHMSYYDMLMKVLSTATM